MLNYYRGDKVLNISYEFRKGILFIRLVGELTKFTSLKLKSEITDMIEDNGITNVVFNISKLKFIDDEGISCLIKNFEICKKNNGSALLCSSNKNNKIIFSNKEIFNDFIDNELSAFEKIEI